MNIVYIKLATRIIADLGRAGGSGLLESTENALLLTENKLSKENLTMGFRARK